MTGKPPSRDWIESLRVMSEMRRSPRMHVRIPLLLVWEENRQEHREQVHTLTISWFGCAIRSYNFFQLGSTVQLRRDDKAIGASVIYCLQDYSTTVVEVGLEFDHDSREFWEIPDWKD